MRLRQLLTGLIALKASCCGIAQRITTAWDWTLLSTSQLQKSGPKSAATVTSANG
jgi:hypothetical protein